MNRVDRLMNILLTLQAKKFVTADVLAEKYDLSTRTIYRDIRALNEMGVPIYFETNKGYTLMQGYFLPPLSFTPEEANSLILLRTLASKFADTSILRQTDTALEKIKAVLKFHDWKKTEKIASKMEVYTGAETRSENNFLAEIQKAVVDKTVLNIQYIDNNNQRTERSIEAIGLIFYTNQWHVLAWCCLREGYRDFKVNQIQQLQTTSKAFSRDHDYTVQDYIKIF